MKTKKLSSLGHRSADRVQVSEQAAYRVNLKASNRRYLSVGFHFVMQQTGVAAHRMGPQRKLAMPGEADSGGIRERKGIVK